MTTTNTAAANLAVVHVGPLAGGIAAKPLDYLDRGQFERYIGACRSAGGRFDPAAKAQITTADRVADLVAALKVADFAVQLDPAIAETLHTAIAAVRAEQDTMRATVDGLIDQLAARGLRLWNFQLEGVAWLRSRIAGVLADDMGLGKTVQALIAIMAGAPVVVLCPAALKGNWVRETNTWRKDLFPSVLRGRGSFRWALPNEVIITNYDVLPAEMTRAPRPGTILIVDEAHALKSAKAIRSKRFKKLATAVLANGGRVWMMTGTPILNRAPELWTLLSHVGLADEAFGSWSEFKRMFGAIKTKFGMQWTGPSGSGEAGAAIRKVCLRRRRTEVLPDLPTKTHTDIPVEITDDAVRALADEIIAKLRAAGVDMDDVMRWMSSPVVFELMSKLRAMMAAAKIPAMLDIVQDIEDTGEPQVVFSAHRAPIDLLASRAGWAVITGDTPPEKRSAIVHEFQAGRLRGLGVTIKAGGVGLTLTKAHQALFVDLEWTPALNCQAEDRICRIGQDRGCIIRRLVAEHELEERVAAKLLEKQLLIDGSVEKAAVREGGHTIASDARAVQLESVLAQVTTIAAAPAGNLRRAPVAVAAPVVTAADECPF